MSPTKVAIRTSNKRPIPVATASPSRVTSRSRSQIACTIARPIQSTPNRVAAIAHETFALRGRTSAKTKVTGNAATSTIITCRGSP